MTVPQILETKRNQKMQKMQYNPGLNQQFTPIVSFQNNYIIYNNIPQFQQGYYPYGTPYIYPGNK